MEQRSGNLQPGEQLLSVTHSFEEANMEKDLHVCKYRTLTLSSAQEQCSLQLYTVAIIIFIVDSFS